MVTKAKEAERRMCDEARRIALKYPPPGTRVTGRLAAQEYAEVAGRIAVESGLGRERGYRLSLKARDDAWRSLGFS
jgi:hypothetical protein